MLALKPWKCRVKELLSKRLNDFLHFKEAYSLYHKLCFLFFSGHFISLKAIN